MSSNVIDLITHLKADVTEFHEGIEKAQRKAESFTEHTSNSFMKMSTVIGASMGFAVGMMVHKLTEGIEKVDQMYIAAQKLGASTGTVQELSLAMHGSGVSAEGTVKNMQMLNRTIGQAALGNEKAMGTFRALGLNLKELTNGDPATNVLKVAAALGKIKNPNLQGALAQQAFGRGGREMMAFINSDIDETMAHVKELNLGLSTDQGENVHKLAEKIHELGVVWEDVAAKGLANSSKMIMNLIDGITSAFNKARMMMSDLMTGVATTKPGQDIQSDGSWYMAAAHDFMTATHKIADAGYSTYETGKHLLTSSHADYDPITTDPKNLPQSNFSQIPSIMSVFKELPTVTNKTSDSIKKMGSAADEVSTQLSTIGSTLKSNDKAGIEGELKRILGDQMKAGGEGSKGVDRSDTFDHFIQQIYRNIQTSGDSAAVENQLKQAMAMADSQVSRNLGYNTAPNVGVVNDLKKYAQEQGGKTPQLDVHLKVEAADSLKVSILGTDARFATISDGTRAIFAQEASGVGK